MITFSSKIIPDQWLGHFNMLRDSARNEAYRQAILSYHKALTLSPRDTSEDIWCDIGCGSGLLGCLVAKIIKCRVVSIECVPTLARVISILIYIMKTFVVTLCMIDSSRNNTFKPLGQSYDSVVGA
jgi:predicted RNA methylase